MGRWAAVVAVVAAVVPLVVVGSGCGAHHGAAGQAGGSATPAAHSCAPPVTAAPGEGQTSFAAAPAVGTVARCPVSRETFKVTAATVRAEHQGRHFAFCCGGCKAKFDADPGRYAR